MQRTYDEIARDDLAPFARLIRAGLPAIMPAHIVFEKVDAQPAGFSPSVVEACSAGDARLRWRRFQRRLEHGGRARRGGHRGAHGGRIRSGMRHGPRVQRSGLRSTRSTAARSARFLPLALARLARLHGRPAATSMVRLRRRPALCRRAPGDRGTRPRCRRASARMSAHDATTVAIRHEQPRGGARRRSCPRSHHACLRVHRARGRPVVRIARAHERRRAHVLRCARARARRGGRMARETSARR